MSEFNIELESGAYVRLKTAGKYCDRDIVVKATGSGDESEYNEGYIAGQQAEYDRFWDAFQQNGNRTNYSYAFYGQGWNDKSFKPKYDIKPNTGSQMFYKSPVTNLVDSLEQAGVTLDMSNCADVYNMFADCTALTEVPHIDLSKANSGTNVFSWCVKLKKIELTLAPSTFSSYSLWFNRCDSLEDLTINGTIDKSGMDLSASTKLTHDSLMSVINALADHAGNGTAYTITLGATNLAKLTDAEKGIATSKGWTLV